MNPRINAWDVLTRLLFERVAVSSDAPTVHPQIDGSRTLVENLIALANEALVTGSLRRCLRSVGIFGELESEAQDYLDAYHELNLRRNGIFRERLLECLRTLNAAGIVPMPLKGAAYMLTGLYADPGERYLSDLDILVPEGTMVSAVEALRRIGFREAETPDCDYTKHHHYPPLVRTLDDPAVELHYYPVTHAAAKILPAGELWADAARRHTADCHYMLASPTDTALLCFVHSELGSRHLARFLINLRAYTDLWTLTKSHGKDVHWHTNLSRAKRGPARVLFRKHAAVFETLTGEPALSAQRPSYHAMTYRLCRTALGQPWIIRLAAELDTLSAAQILHAKRTSKMSRRVMIATQARRLRRLLGRWVGRSATPSSSHTMT